MADAQETRPGESTATETTAVEAEAATIEDTATAVVAKFPVLEKDHVADSLDEIKSQWVSKYMSGSVGWLDCACGGS